MQTANRDSPKNPTRTPPQPGLQQYFDLLVASVVDYAFITLDSENRVTAWNIGAERILGYTEAEILGKSGAVFFTPEDRNAGEVEHELETAIRDNRAADERWHLRKDGSRFWASGVMTVLRDAGGPPCGFAKVLRDLTEAKRAQEAVRESQERLRLFVENVRDHALFQLGPDGCIASWNTGAERLFGYSQDQIIGQHVSSLFLPEDRARKYAEEELARALAESSAEDQRWVLRRDGTRFFARWVTHPMFDGDGHLRGFAKVLRDETERLRGEQARQHRVQQERANLQSQVQNTGAELDRTKDELRALAASLITAEEEERRRIARELHDDLSQRLGVLEVTVAHLEQRMPQEERAELATVREQVAALSEQVRVLSRGLHPAILDDLGLEPALRALIEEFRTVHKLSVALVSVPLPRQAPGPVGTALYRITQEALRNVVRHAPHARVTVRLSHDDQGLRLTIKDDGPGFDPEMMRSRGGLGIVSMGERARLLGGTLDLRSAPGAGTEVTVRVRWPEGA